MSENLTLAGQTVETARRAVAARFKAGSIDSPELDARLLIGAVLDLDLTGMITAGGQLLSTDEAARLEDMAIRRLAGEPVARILAVREFWGLSLNLSPATLVPRPDTETIVELALDIARGMPPGDQPLRIADIGTGSGAILLALLHELPGARGLGTDISETALQTARTNAVRLGLAGRARFVACDYAAALAGATDLIVSNPPYIRTAEIASLDREVRDHDPRRALDGGPDGLDAYRAIIPQASRLLTEGGALVLEIGYGQGPDVQALMTTAGLTLAGTPKVDLAGIGRAVAGQKLPR